MHKRITLKNRNKKNIKKIGVCALCLSFLGASVPATFVQAAGEEIAAQETSITLKGSGTEEDPYQLSTPEDLYMIHNDMNAYYEFTNDIDMDGYHWITVGARNNRFYGYLNGNGYTLWNIDECFIGYTPHSSQLTNLYYNWTEE